MNDVILMWDTGKDNSRFTKSSGNSKMREEFGAGSVKNALRKRSHLAWALKGLLDPDRLR